MSDLDVDLSLSALIVTARCCDYLLTYMGVVFVPGLYESNSFVAFLIDGFGPAVAFTLLMSLTLGFLLLVWSVALIGERFVAGGSGSVRAVRLIRRFGLILLCAVAIIPVVWNLVVLSGVF